MICQREPQQSIRGVILQLRLIQRLLRLRFGQPDLAKKAVRIRPPWAQFKCLIKVGLCLLQPASVIQNYSFILITIGVERIGRNGTTVERKRLVKVAEESGSEPPTLITPASPGLSAKAL